MQPVIEVRQLTKLYRNQRGIADLNMTVQQGDIYGFFGPNGAGKTTVMKVMTGLARADRGEIRLFGQPVSARYEQAMAQVGVMIEAAEAYTYMSGRRNLELAARFYPGIGQARIDEVLELTGLTAYQHEKAAGYSLGMKQRLGLAGALLSKPKLLILDEPTNGLDIEGTVQMRETMLCLAREESITFLISSHLIHEMELMCSRIGVLHHGRLIGEGLVKELTEAHGTLERAYLRILENAGRAAAYA
ncbi:ABC-2 type transport system ATP-binding protein [Paenibacillus sp. UNCCL117]|uniref:ABC transporter ATP-binding protein n=1 Tax=unclassified Paenibacillus TaxID=185978 RepID=UPI00087E1B15|nr:MULTISPECIES: ATP-binding cassette domain-containing protein [unclassified Paenibacillus]SDE51454.1 ABC-2 type transport system ATP-binding protein [Paenibacillus sp. cl123]SFW67144.1 ABC-2 type transport system ATP-binding protein [Paenibacillus sp. UNCCL117]